MKKARTTALWAMLLAVSMLLCSCSLFVRQSPSSEQPTGDPPPKEEKPDADAPDGEENATEPTVKELLEGMTDYDFGKVTLMLAAADDCKLLEEESDSRSVLTTVLDAIEEKYGASIAVTAYSQSKLYAGVSDMAHKGGGTAYFADVLILSVTDFVRYRGQDLLSRLELLPFLDTTADCFDASLTKLLSGEDGTYGVVGAGSHTFKAQITLFFNPELLTAAGIDFDGYGMAEKGTFDLAALQKVLSQYSEKTGQDALVSDLSEEVTDSLLETISAQGITPAQYGNEGYLSFMMGKTPFMIGTMGDVEKMPTARDKYGMLPIPYTEDGAYKTFYDTDRMYVFCVPKGNARTDCTGIFLQAYHEASRYLPYRYFADQLIEKYVWDEGTLRIILRMGKTAELLPSLKK